MCYATLAQNVCVRVVRATAPHSGNSTRNTEISKQADGRWLNFSLFGIRVKWKLRFVVFCILSTVSHCFVVFISARVGPAPSQGPDST